MLLGTFAHAQTPAALTIVDIRVQGNKQMTTGAVLANIKLRAGQPYDETLVKADVQRLLQTRRFDSVTTTRQADPKGVILVFNVVERPLVKKLVITGVREFKLSRILKELPFGQGDPIDKQNVEAGRERILTLYHDQGFFDATVTYDAKAFAEDREVHYRVVEGPQATVRKIVFEGNTFFSNWKLGDTVGTKTRIWIFRKGYLDMEQLPRDTDALRNLYVSEGFLDAEAGYELEFSPDRSKVTVRFLIRQGPRFRVNELKFVGNTIYADRELASRMPLKNTEFFTSLKMQRSIRALQDAYGEYGFIEADIKVQRQFLSPETPLPDWAKILDSGKPALLNILFTIEEKDQYRIGRAEVRGNTITQDRVIRRELRFFPNQLFNTVAIDESRRRLQESGLFEAKSVQITPLGEEQLDQDKHKVHDVLVAVKEGATAQFIIGAGYSTRDGLLGNISFTQSNFDISNPGGWDEIKRGTAWKGAGQTFRVQVQPGLDMSTASMQWYTPYIGTSEYSWSSKAFLFERQRETYLEERAGLVNALGHRFKNDWYGELANRIEDVTVKDVERSAPIEVKEDEGSHLIVGLQPSLIRDRTDSRILPSQGDRLKLSYEQVVGDYVFGVIEADYRRYYTVYTDALDRKHILSFRVMGGQIVGDAPVFEKFYGGGLGSIRGFKYRGISPRGGIHSDPIGGDFTFFAGSEYTFPIVGDQLRGVLFLDTGTVDESTTLSHYRAAVGPGIRWVIPIFGQVPLNLDLGFPILKQEHDDTQIFQFSIGVNF